MKLFIGNGSKDAHNECKRIFGDCELLDNATVVDSNKNYHTSINDVPPRMLEDLIGKANEVVVGDFKPNEFIVQSILRSKKLLPFNDILGEEITVSEDQLIIIGCSHTVGVGLDNKDKRYSTLVSNNFNLRELNLGTPGAGIPYISNVFHRCKFNPKQKVILQISSPDRVYQLSTSKYWKLSLDNRNDAKVLTLLPDELLLATAYSNITNMIYAARHLNLDFLCFTLAAQSNVQTQLDYLLSGFEEYMPLYDYCYDYTNDGHFGEKTHKYLSELITNYYLEK